MKKTKVTIKDVAALAGVSPATVSMVLNGSNKFPEQTCRKVIDACNQLGYVRGELLRAESTEEPVLCQGCGCHAAPGQGTGLFPLCV